MSILARTAPSYLAEEVSQQTVLATLCHCILDLGLGLQHLPQATCSWKTLRSQPSVRVRCSPAALHCVVHLCFQYKGRNPSPSLTSSSTRSMLTLPFLNIVHQSSS